MSQQVTVSTAADVLVLLTKDNVAVTGLTFSDVTAEFRKEGEASFSAFVLTAPNFTEIGNGVYEITYTASELDTVGSFLTVVLGATIDQSTTLVDVLSAGQSTTAVSLTTCLISGHIFDAAGQPAVGASVTAMVVGLPSIEQNSAAVTDDRVSVKTGSNGEFFLPLVRLADVEIVIPAANYRRRLVVPNQTSARLFVDIP